jgi:hypothetical protein
MILAWEKLTEPFVWFGLSGFFLQVLPKLLIERTLSISVIIDHTSKKAILGRDNAIQKRGSTPMS